MNYDITTLIVFSVALLNVCASAQSDKEPVNAYFTTAEMKAYKKAVAKRAKSKK
ncbi:MAG: hypothetical protein IJQ04_05065 [Prevotella sp.]|nr:hypothetical protein [Prevotella sp.]